MYKIRKIEVEDFITFERLIFEFEDRLYCLYGHNEDSEIGGSNGSGKTAFLDAVSVALLGKTLSGRSLRQCIREGYKTFCVKISITDGNDIIEIERRCHESSRQHQELFISKNGAFPDELLSKSSKQNQVDIRDGQRYIFDLLGISEIDIYSFFIVGKDGYIPFVKQSASRKVAVLSRLSGAEKLDHISSQLKAEAKQLERDLDDIRSNIVIYQNKVNIIGRQIEKNKESKYEQSKKLELELIGQIKEYENNIGQYKSKLEKQQFNIRSLKESYNNYNSEKSRLQTVFDKACYYRDILRYLFRLRSLSCPNCGTIIEDTSVAQIKDDIRVRVDKKREEMGLEAVIVAYQSAYDELYDGRFSKIDIDRLDRYSFLHDIDTKLNGVKKREATLQKEVSYLRRDIDNGNQQIQSLNKKKQEIWKSDDQDADLIIEYDEAKNALVSLEKRLKGENNKHRDLVKDISFYKSFNFFLSKNICDIIARFVNNTLSEFNLDYVVNISLKKLLAGGDVREDVNVKVYENGHYRNYESFSMGERAKLNVAFDLAIRNLVNNFSETGLDLYINDEGLSNLDDKGVQIVSSLLSKKKQLSLICTHSNPESYSEYDLLIRKRAGKSHVYES